MAAKAKMATAACSGWPIPLRSHGVANATALTVAASRSDAEIRATATRNAPRPALAKRRSAPRDELTWKKPSAPDKNAAAQPALIAVAERLGEGAQDTGEDQHEEGRHRDQQRQRQRRPQLLPNEAAAGGGKRGQASTAFPSFNS